MRYALVLVGLILLAGCETAPPSLQGLPVDVTRNTTISDPATHRRYVLSTNDEYPSYPATTEAGRQAIITALKERGWVEDETNPNATIEWGWGYDPRQLSTEWGWSETTLYYPGGFYYPYGFYPGPFFSPDPMVSVTRASYPIWVTVVIRDPAAAPTATPLFRGKASTALGYPSYEDYLPLLVDRLFAGFLKPEQKRGTKETPAAAP